MKTNISTIWNQKLISCPLGLFLVYSSMIYKINGKMYNKWMFLVTENALENYNLNPIEPH